jgi:hypothetical protein
MSSLDRLTNIPTPNISGMAMMTAGATWHSLRKDFRVDESAIISIVEATDPGPLRGPGSRPPSPTPTISST